MRNAFAREMLEIAEAHEEAVLLMGDIGNRLFDNYKEKYSDRFFNCGVAEANMVSVAAGMASCGLHPICYTITPFMTARCYEQIRIDLCYHNVPSVIVGTGAGLSYASLGATHHSFDDLAIMRVLPEMRVLCPGDAHEVGPCLQLAMKESGPVYVRLGKKNEPLIHEAPPQLETGRFFPIGERGEDVALLSCGNVLPIAVEAAEQLRQLGHSTEVMSCFSVKPLDEKYLAEAFERFRVIVTLEEHSLIGGFGSAVLEWENETASDLSSKAKLIRFGIPDAFFHNAAEQQDLREECGLTAENIRETVAAQLSTA